MHDDLPLDPAARLGDDYYALALALLELPASIDAAGLAALPSLLACAPNAAKTAAHLHLSLDELQDRLARLSTGERVALVFAAERRQSAE